MTVVVPPSIARTFAVLGSADDLRGGERLVTALDVPRAAIQVAAAEAILQRGAQQPRIELLARLEQLPEDVLQRVRQAGSRLDGTFRQMLGHGDLVTRRIALRALLLTEQYGQISQLLDLLGRATLPDLDDIADVFRKLIDRLYDDWQCRQGRAATASPILPARTLALAALDSALANWPHLARPDDVLEAALVLGDPECPAVKRALWQGAAECRDKAAQRLLESRHPGVMRLVADSLSQGYPHPKVFEAIRRRDDPEFIAELLRSLTRNRSAQRLQQLKQVSQIAWLEPPFHLLDAIPPVLHPELILLVNAAAVPRETKVAVQEWMLRHGTPQGRQAATEGLPLVAEDVIQDVVREGLESDDEDIQAWATTQLRAHAIPEAYALLVERLDSPLPAVAGAARQELSGFSALRVLSMARELNAGDARRAGQLLMKIDLDAPTVIRRELAHPVRQKRIKAAMAVHWLGLQEHFTSAFVAMTEDTDPLVRRTGAEILSTMTAAEAHCALLRLQDDPHARVRETARAALEAWDQEICPLPAEESLSRPRTGGFP